VGYCSLPPTMALLPFCDLDSLAAAIPDGAQLALPADTYGVAMAATRALVRRGVRALDLVCVPTSGIQADVLIGAGCASAIETSAVALGEYGTAPRFAAAVREGSLRVLDATCPAIHAGLQASQKGLPFMPVRGILGSDLLAQRTDWKVVDNPFAPGDRIVAVRAIKPDVALFHAPCADRCGNVLVARNRDLLTMAQASRAAFVTVEELIDGDLLADRERSPGVIPAVYVTRIAVAPRGAWPLGLAGRYDADAAALERYARAAKTSDGFRAWLDEWLAREPAVSMGV
jgi:glutaconate CoA-transferase subunit A